MFENIVNHNFSIFKKFVKYIFRKQKNQLSLALFFCL